MATIARSSNVGPAPAISKSGSASRASNYTSWRPRNGPDTPRVRSCDLKHRSHVPLFMVSPTSHLRLAWELGVIAPLVIYLVAALPFSLCFKNEARGGLAIFNIVVDMLFLTDMLLIFRTGLVDKLSREHNYNTWLIAKNYFRSWFIVDFVSSIPFGILELKAFDGNSGIQALKDISVIRMMKMLRVLKIAKLIKGAHIMKDLDQDQADMVQDFLARKITKTTLRISNILLTLAFLVHIMSCLWVAVGRSSLAHGLDSWLEHDFEEYEAKDTTGGNEVGSIYLSAFYFCLTTMTTVGFGDIQPRNGSERGFVICLEVMGGLFYAYIVGSLTAIITKGDPNHQKVEEVLEAVSSYIDRIRLPAPLGRRMRRFYRAHFDKRAAVNEAEILGRLTVNLQTEVAHFLAEGDLKCAETVVFRLMPPPLWAEFLPLLRPCMFERGEVVCMQGDYCAEALLVTEGAFTGATDVGTGDWLKPLGVDLNAQALDEGSILREASEIEEWQQKLEESMHVRKLKRSWSSKMSLSFNEHQVSAPSSDSPPPVSSAKRSNLPGIKSRPTSSPVLDKELEARIVEESDVDIDGSRDLKGRDSGVGSGHEVSLREEHNYLNNIVSSFATLEPDETKDHLRVRLCEVSQESIPSLLRWSPDTEDEIRGPKVKKKTFPHDRNLHLRVITNGQVVNLLGLYRVWYQCLESVKAAGAVECFAVNNEAFADIFSSADKAAIFEGMQERVVATQFEMMPDPGGEFGSPTKWGVPLYRLSKSRIRQKERKFAKAQAEDMAARRRAVAEHLASLENPLKPAVSSEAPVQQSKTPSKSALTREGGDAARKGDEQGEGALTTIFM